MALQTVPLSLCKCLNCRINLSRVCMFVCDCVCVCAHCFSQEWQHKLMTDERLFNPVETRRNTLDNNWELKPCRVIITYHSVWLSHQNHTVFSCLNLSWKLNLFLSCIKTVSNRLQLKVVPFSVHNPTHQPTYCSSPGKQHYDEMNSQIDWAH